MLPDYPTQAPDTFTAKNGVNVALEPNAYGQDHMRTLVVTGGKPGHTFPVAYHEDQVQALREYFQHERDEQLGRWRDPKAPNFVTYHSDIEYVRVVNESTGTSDKAWRDDPHALSTAKRYFAAHPEPKPWYDAQSGELWILTINGEQVGALAWRPAPGPTFETATGTLRHDDPDITAGRRIWPTGADDE